MSKSDAKKDEKNNKNRKVFVGGIPKNMNVDQLRKHFSKFGKITSAQIPQRFGGFGFVEFETAEACKKALKEPRQEIEGKMFDVVKYGDQKKNQSGASDKTQESKPSKPPSSMSQEEQDIRELLAKRQAESKTPTTESKPKGNSNSNTQSITIANQRTQLRSLEECMKNLHSLNSSKSAEIENLHKEIKNLTDQIATLTAQNENLKLKNDEYSSLLKEVHSVLMDDEKSKYSVPDCSLCCIAKVDSTMVPCGHCCLCYECGTNKGWDSNGRKCLICRKQVDQVMKIFL